MHVMATQIKDPVSAPASKPAAAAYAADGFVVLPQLITPEFCEILNARLERVLRGEHDTGTPPDKAPTFKAEARAKPGKAPPPIGGPSKRMLQIINIFLKRVIRILGYNIIRTHNRLARN